MQTSYLIQRLQAPYNDKPDAKLTEASSFGGGYRHGGISEEGMKLLRDIFSFDYMGAAQFEFGAVLEALNIIAKDADNYDTFIVQFHLKKGIQKVLENSKFDHVHLTKPIYVIARPEWKEEIIKRLEGFANNDIKNFFTRERVNLDLSLKGTWRDGTPITNPTQGWLELDNGYFFFINKEMFKKTVKLFGVKNNLILT